LNEVGAILQVRWPEGAAYVGELKNMIEDESLPHHDLDLFNVACDLFFPQKRKFVPLNPHGSLFAGLDLGHPRQGV
jgi:hypothetical protein